MNPESPGLCAELRFARGGELGVLLDALVKVGEAVAYAHAQGIVHRDIKPANVLLDGAGDAKIADFGIAKVASEEEGWTLTRTGQGLGTPAYVAPGAGARQTAPQVTPA